MKYLIFSLLFLTSLKNNPSQQKLFRQLARAGTQELNEKIETFKLLRKLMLNTKNSEIKHGLDQFFSTHLTTFYPEIQKMNIACLPRKEDQLKKLIKKQSLLKYELLTVFKSMKIITKDKNQEIYFEIHGKNLALIKTIIKEATSPHPSLQKPSENNAKF